MLSSISSKKKQKPVNLSYHSSKVEFVCSFFGGNWWPQKISSKLTNIYQLLSKTHSAYRDLLNTREERLKLCLLLRRSGVSPGRPRSLLMSQKSVWFTSMMSTGHLSGPSKGQLISKCPYEKSVSSKIPTKIFLRFLPWKFTTSRLTQKESLCSICKKIDSVL